MVWRLFGATWSQAHSFARDFGQDLGHGGVGSVAYFCCLHPGCRPYLHLRGPTGLRRRRAARAELVGEAGFLAAAPAGAVGCAEQASWTRVKVVHRLRQAGTFDLYVGTRGFVPPYCSGQDPPGNFLFWESWDQSAGARSS